MKSNYTKELLSKYKGEIVVNVILLIMISLLSVGGPLFIRNAINKSIEQGIQISLFVTFILILSGTYLVKFIHHRFKFWFGNRFKINETVNLYDKAFHMSYLKINSLEPTYITERIAGTVTNVYNLFSSSISGIFVSALTIILLLIVTFRINRMLALLYFIQIPLQYFGFQKILNGKNSPLAKIHTELQEVRGKYAKDIKAIMSDVNAIKQFCDEDGLLRIIGKHVSFLNQKERKGNQFAMDVCILLEYLCMVLKYSTYILIIYYMITGEISVGDLVYLNLINDIYFGAIGDVISIQVNLLNLHGSIAFVEDEIEQNKEDDGDVEISKVNTISGNVNNIGYGDHEIIKEANINIKCGDIVFFGSSSGAGKSTFVKLLNKFISSEGLLINDIPLSDIKNKDIRDRIYYVPQNAYLLPGTLRDNISIGREFAKEKWDSLYQLGFMKKFLESEEGMDLKILENASNLSGGDCQKIILARIFMYSPDVIILDESFNSIDEETSEDIIHDILQLFSDRIIIMISHDSDLNKYCNKSFRIQDKVLRQESAHGE